MLRVARQDCLLFKGNPLCHPQVAAFLVPLQLLDPAWQPRARSQPSRTPLLLLPELLLNALASLAMGPDPMNQGSAGG